MNTRDMLFRGCVLLLLTAILVMQILIWNATVEAKPPTQGDLREATGDAREEIYLRMPMVRVMGAVHINR